MTRNWKLFSFGPRGRLKIFMVLQRVLQEGCQSVRVRKGGLNSCIIPLKILNISADDLVCVAYLYPITEASEGDQSCEDLLSDFFGSHMKLEDGNEFQNPKGSLYPLHTNNQGNNSNNRPLTFNTS